MKLPPGWAGRPWDEREQRLGESPNGRKSCKTADPKEAVCKATCLKDGFQRNFTLPSCPMQTCSACRFTGSCLDFRHLARAGRFPLFIPLIFGTFHQGKVQKKRFILAKEWRFRRRSTAQYRNSQSIYSCAFAGSKAPKNLTRTMRLPALKNQRKSNEPSPFGRDGLLAEARFKDLLLFFHSLPALPAVRACPRTQPGKGLKFFDSFSRKTTS